MLVNHTLFGVEDKVTDAINLLRQYEPPEGYYVCFSGGKDSVVVLDLVKRAGVKFTAYHNITTVEPPEVMKFIAVHHKDVVPIHPKTSMYGLIVKNGIPPLRQMRYCCRILKENVGKDFFKVTGVRAEESPRRAKRPQIELGKDRFLHVIHKWTADDIWEYIHSFNVPYCSLYDEGFNRVGCVLCPFHSIKQTKQEYDRYPQIVRYYRTACITAYKNNPKLHNSPNFHDGESLFNWWINHREKHRIIANCSYVPLFSEDDGYLI